jgi:non-canonical purine NTP pyrophosphatase (RdgB/HAM1 family)
MHTMILATRNAGKLEEIRSLLSFLPIDLISLEDIPGIPDIIENGSTFEENAFIKARFVFQSTNIPALADDSGLEVFALDKRPGIYSARYAGENVSYEANNKKLLTELDGVPTSLRHAQFRCAAAFVAPAVEHLVHGICRGVIVESPRGVNGFGYDPLFLPEGYDRTFAELPLDIKNSISHRSQAFKSMSLFLKEFLRRIG